MLRPSCLHTTDTAVVYTPQIHYRYYEHDRRKMATHTKQTTTTALTLTLNPNRTLTLTVINLTINPDICAQIVDTQNNFFPSL